MKQTSVPAAAPVVIAAGGLGTRVGSWSPYLPKELRPVHGRPGLAHIVDEVTTLGSKQAVVVHHPYYTALIGWTRQVLIPGALAQYHRLTDQTPPSPVPGEDLQLDFIAQHGRYADVTSVLRRCLDWCWIVAPGMDIVLRLVPDRLWEIFQDV
ncbi:hypothetical protein ACWCXC_31915, partial [Streptomyces sp. NPDC001515]